jgi:hypothetical protein
MRPISLAERDGRSSRVRVLPKFLGGTNRRHRVGHLLVATARPERQQRRLLNQFALMKFFGPTEEISSAALSRIIPSHRFCRFFCSLEPIETHTGANGRHKTTADSLAYRFRNARLKKRSARSSHPLVASTTLRRSGYPQDPQKFVLDTVLPHQKAIPPRQLARPRACH